MEDWGGGDRIGKDSRGQITEHIVGNAKCGSYHELYMKDFHKRVKWSGLCFLIILFCKRGGGVREKLYLSQVEPPGFCPRGLGGRCREAASALLWWKQSGGNGLQGGNYRLVNN